MKASDTSFQRRGRPDTHLNEGVLGGNGGQTDLGKGIVRLGERVHLEVVGVLAHAVGLGLEHDAAREWTLRILGVRQPERDVLLVGVVGLGVDHDLRVLQSLVGNLLAVLGGEGLEALALLELRLGRSPHEHAKLRLYHLY